MKKIIYLFIAALLFSCNNDDTPTAAPIPVPAPTESIVFFQALLNGQTFNYSQDNSLSPTHSYTFANGYSGLGFDKSFYYGCIMEPYPPSSDFYPRIDLTFSNMYQSTDASTETDAFYGLFTTIPTNFISYADDSNWIKGINVTYLNSSGVIYSTLSGSQTGSVMTVTSSNTGVNSTNNFKNI